MMTNTERKMSKKDFEVLAKHIRMMMERRARLDAAVAVSAAAAEMNPRFNAQKFFEACGV